jgi:hypothetical protein
MDDLEYWEVDDGSRGEKNLRGRMGKRISWRGGIGLDVRNEYERVDGVT